ncbi:major facilitator superfamily domain-containing protein [Aspergillus recurvatus]
MTVSEESPLLGSPRDEETGKHPSSRKESDSLVIYAAFLGNRARLQYKKYGSPSSGVFIASADELLVISTYSAIASQFHRLSEGSWLLLAYNFGYCISLPVFSVLGDQYGRKRVLIGSYVLFAISCLACGASLSIPQLVLSRVLAGSSGAGIIVMASVIITDMTPVDEVALYRGYQNVVNIVGRSLGGPIGGFLADTVGWRWSFFGQVPIVISCALFCVRRLPSYLNQTETKDESTEDPVPASRQPGICDLDFAGLFTFAGTILLLLFLLRALGAQNEGMFFQTSLLAFSFVCGCIIFIMIELFWAPKPLVPIRLFSQTIGIYFLCQTLLMGGRFAWTDEIQLYSNLVPYFIRTQNTSDFVASLALVVSAAGVAVGGIVCGLTIKRTKRSKTLILSALTLNLLSHILIFIQWRRSHAATPWQHVRDSIYLFGTGMAPGILFPALFTVMASVAPEGELHGCIGTYYLFQQLGVIIGPAAGAAVNQAVFEKGLWRALRGIEEKRVIISRILNEVRYADSLPASLQTVVRECYLTSFQYLPSVVVSEGAFLWTHDSHFVATDKVLENWTERVEKMDWEVNEDGVAGVIKKSKEADTVEHWQKYWIPPS